MPNLASYDNEISVPVTWPSCMNAEVNPYKPDARNLTNAKTTYNIELKYLAFNGGYIIYSTLFSQIAHTALFTSIYKAGLSPQTNHKIDKTTI